MHESICRARHADVLEWLWFLNSHRKPVSKWMWGDKDTYRLAFALADKADHFQQVCSLRDAYSCHALVGHCFGYTVGL